jgi:hypothetical protein
VDVLRGDLLRLLTLLLVELGLLLARVRLELGNVVHERVEQRGPELRAVRADARLLHVVEHGEQEVVEDRVVRLRARRLRVRRRARLQPLDRAREERGDVGRAAELGVQRAPG